MEQRDNRLNIGDKCPCCNGQGNLERKYLIFHNNNGIDEKEPALECNACFAFFESNGNMIEKGWNIGEQSVHR